MPAFGLAFFIIISLLSACAKPRGMQLEGVYGTALWHVTLTDEFPAGLDQVVLRAGITQALSKTTQQIAGWDKSSEISQFNAHQSTQWFAVSPDVARLSELALRLSAESAGIYDITVRPLITLWGFDSAQETAGYVPVAEEIAAARARVGYQKLQVQLEPPALRKTQVDLHVELASLADGFAADVVGEYLESLGLTNYMVEIAGEIRTRGVSPRGDAWRVAIEKPLDGQRAVQQGVRLRNAGLATSGDYRNFFIKDGKRYSHTLDPATGYPVTHQLASVSVVAQQGALADAYATLLMAMGEVKGKAFADQHALAAYFVWRTDAGFEVYATPAFTQLLMD
ncbi:FAD:protein FMN transferase [Candidatus Thiothrix anitrata]|uniref:FAD:protein FMN transferase n=1 Tax=Candidatus Thiothrix anitrata TaxID=2823902 RepID=A0ABX7X872_9GAMM|nr:FAD:protein FMN transferase [Candidatus Thiothrix anitrata]QTR50550.1 FAD:protein FMN transferase [Candidatus Thiothrix anitrata]